MLPSRPAFNRLLERLPDYTSVVPGQGEGPSQVDVRGETLRNFTQRHRLHGSRQFAESITDEDLIELFQKTYKPLSVFTVRTAARHHSTVRHTRLPFHGVTSHSLHNTPCTFAQYGCAVQ